MGLLVAWVAGVALATTPAEAEVRRIAASCAPDTEVAAVSCVDDRCAVMFPVASDELRRRITSCPAWQEAYGLQVDSQSGQRTCGDGDVRDYLMMWPTGPFPGTDRAAAFPCDPLPASGELSIRSASSAPLPPTDWVYFEPSAAPQLGEVSADAFRRRRRVSRIGLGLLVASYPVVVAASLGIGECGFQTACEGIFTGAALAGGMMHLGGGLAFFVGGISASNAVAGVTAPGVVGLTLWLSSGVAALLFPPLGVVMSLGGQVLGAVQLSHATSVAHIRGVRVSLVPRPDGVAIAARF